MQRWMNASRALPVMLGLLGCGGDEGKPQGAAGAGGTSVGAGASPAGTAGNAMSGGGGQSGGSASGGSASGGKPAGGPLDCTGTFGTALPGMVDEGGVRLASPTLSPDGLELLYVRELGEQIEFRRSTRTSQAEPCSISTKPVTPPLRCQS